jgi:hypothetical protein
LMAPLTEQMKQPLRPASSRQAGEHFGQDMPSGAGNHSARNGGR